MRRLQRLNASAVALIAAAALTIAPGALFAQREIVPADRFSVADGSKRGLQAEYFDGVELKRRILARTDEKIDSAWGNGPSLFARSKPSETNLTLELPAGKYAAEWIDTKTGATAKREEFKHDGGARKLTAPEYKDDIALRVKK